MNADFDTILSTLKSLADPHNVEGMARFGINPSNTLGVSMVKIRAIARGNKSHALAAQLWDCGIHEARILASLVDCPQWVTEDQMERWVVQFDSWDICDQVCSNLFSRTPFAIAKIFAWTARPEEFVKRAGFVMIANLAVHDKQAPDQLFLDFLPLIEREAADPRNFVKKAVNWALRQVGKRNANLHSAAIACAESIQNNSSSAARWVAADALRELNR